MHIHGMCDRKTSQWPMATRWSLLPGDLWAISQLLFSVHVFSTAWILCAGRGGLLIDSVDYWEEARMEFRMARRHTSPMYVPAHLCLMLICPSYWLASVFACAVLKVGGWGLCCGDAMYAYGLLRRTWCLL